MADWRKMAMQAILADGKIEDAEVKILKKALWADGKISKVEVEFLIELRSAAQKKAKKDPLNPKFEKLFFDAISSHVLKDGKISAEETAWLKSALYADKKIDDGEKKFLQRLMKGATSVSPAFTALYNKAVGKK